MRSNLSDLLSGGRLSCRGRCSDWFDLSPSRDAVLQHLREDLQTLRAKHRANGAVRQKEN